MSIKETISTSLSKAFELILNQKIKLDEEQGSAFNKVDEKVIQLTFTDIKQTFFVIYQSNNENNTFVVQTHLLGQADSQLKTTIIDWISHQTKADKRDTVGTDFLTALHSIEIDWEEMLSHYTGDMIAFQIGSTLRNGQQKLKATKQKTGKTIEEYLHFEVNLLPTKSQVNRFKKQVQQTEKSVDELEKRLKALTQN
jgi:ubiquinone biosynthesis protein UbiJ